MSDELERLRSAMKEAMPPASDEARARALQAGLENFDRVFQGSAAQERPSVGEPRGAAPILEGLKAMWTTMTSRKVLLATTSLGTIALALIVTREILPGEIGPLVRERTEATAPDMATLTDATGDDTEVVVVEEPVAQVVTDELAKAESDLAASPPAMTGITATAPMDTGAAELTFGDLSRSNLYGPPAEPEAFVAPQPVASPDGDVFAGEAANPLKITSAEPVSTFSIDVDTASYSYVRAALLDGYRPQADAVRIEEMVNYFDYAYPQPDNSEVPFRTSVSVTGTPWNEGTRLVHIAIQGWQPDDAARAPANLVFLIDTSGSMEDADKLPLLIQSFRLMLANLRPDDKIAIVTYAGSAGLVLEPTAVSEKAKILASLTNLSAGGSTAGAEGLQQAYQVAAGMIGDGQNARVILATDGDFNVGISDPEELKTFIARQRDSGVFLSVLGFGRGNYDDATMQALAQNGNGQAAYIDTLAEAQKVLVQDIAATLVPIANDVKIQVEWNPATVAEYRLIGYETRALNREDFNNDRIDAGEIGSGHTITALYEITPVGSDAVLTSPLRYGTGEPATPSADQELGYLKLRYKLPGNADSRLIETPITADLAEIAPSESHFAAAVAGFGELLRGNPVLGDWSYDDVAALADASRGDDPFGYRAEFIRLIELAGSAQ